MKLAGLRLALLALPALLVAWIVAQTGALTVARIVALIVAQTGGMTLC